FCKGDLASSTSTTGPKSIIVVIQTVTASTMEEAMSHGANPRRKRASKACVACRSRKVRCDVTHRPHQCTNCALDNIQCVVKDRRTKYRKRSPVVLEKQQRTQFRHSLQAILPKDPSSAVSDDMDTLNDPCLEPGHSVECGPESPSMCFEAVWDEPEISFPAERFIQGPTESRDKESEIFDMVLNQRKDSDFTVVSDSSRLHQTESKPAPNFDATMSGQSHIIYSYYSFLDLDISGLLPDDINYLEGQGCFRVPTPEALDEFVQEYFLHVHPALPLLDEAWFWTIYSRPARGRSNLSLFVFQAMLFTACSFLPFSTLKSLGFASVHNARNTYYRRSKLLFDLCSERNLVSSAQGALLLSYNGTMKDQKRTNSIWLSTAIHLAQAAGADQFHTSLNPSLTSSCEAGLEAWFERATIQFPTPAGIITREGSLVLYTNLLYIYYYAACFALYQHKAFIISQEQTKATSDLEQTKSKIEDAALGITENLKELIQLRLERFLPISIAAYIAVPLVLHILDVRLAKRPLQIAQKQGKLNVYVETMKTMQKLYDGVDDVWTFIRTAMDYATIQDAENETSSPNGSCIDAVGCLGSKSQLTKGNDYANDWGNVLVMEPILYFRLSRTIDHSLALGRYSEDSTLGHAAPHTRLPSPRLLTIDIGSPEQTVDDTACEHYKAPRADAKSPEVSQDQFSLGPQMLDDMHEFVHYDFGMDDMQAPIDFNRSERQAGETDVLILLPDLSESANVDKIKSANLPKMDSFQHCCVPYRNRYFVHLYETSLRDECGYGGFMPYWDWTIDSKDMSKSPIFSKDKIRGFGGNGLGGGFVNLGRPNPSTMCVLDGAFNNFTVQYHDQTSRPHCLNRGFNDELTPAGKFQGDSYSPHAVSKIMRDSKNFTTFTRDLENGSHGAIHQAIGGDIVSSTSPNNPVFFLHHAQIDRLW
ncbi:unnamed protein product, partial [Fusarium fujikuroi]